MFDKNLQKDTFFIILATLLLIIYTISSYVLTSRTIEDFFIPGFCFAFAFLILAWILTHQSHLRKTWTYLTIFILTFIYISYWKIIFFLFNSSPKYLKPFNHDLLRNVTNLQFFLNFFIILIIVWLFWYLVKPKDFQDKKFSFPKKENYNKTIISIFIPFLITFPYWLTYIISFLNKDFFSDLFASNETMYYLFISFYRGVPFFVAAILFSILINRLKEKKRLYLFFIVGVLVLIQSISVYLLFDVQSYDSFTNIVFSTVKNGCCFFIIFFSLLLLAKERYLE